VWLTFVLKVFGLREVGDHEGIGQDLARGAYLRPRNSDDQLDGSDVQAQLGGAWAHSRLSKMK